MLPRPRVRPVQMCVQYGTYTAFHRLNRLRQQAIELLPGTSLSGPQVTAGRRLGYARVIG